MHQPYGLPARMGFLLTGGSVHSASSRARVVVMASIHVSPLRSANDTTYGLNNYTEVKAVTTLL
jgi:hypothetical protein